MIGHLTAVLLALALISSVTSDTVRFREDAGENVNWQFKLKPRSGVKDVSVISLDWEPSSMVENSGGLQQDDFGVEIKSGEGEFGPIEEQPRLRGGKYLYEINIVPCEEQRIRFFVKSGEAEPAYFEYPEVIPASSDEDIARSSYELSPPQGGQVTEEGEEVSLSWSPSKCATSYLLTDLETEEMEVFGTSLSVSLSSLAKECGQYDVSVTAVRGEKYSDSLLLPPISTRPVTTAVESLEVELIPGQHSLTAKWKGHQALPCVTTYTARVCEAEEDEKCQPSVELTVDQGLTYVEFTSQEALTECSRYSLFIRPVFPGTELEEKRFDFSTSSPQPSDISAVLTSVSASLSSDKSVLVSWEGGKCVSHYRVFQQAVTSPPTTAWDLVQDLPNKAGTQHQLNTPGVPCTQVIYGVKAVIEGTESEMMKAVEPVNIPLDSEEPFTATGLTAVPSTSSLELSWEHPTCVESYRVVACPGGDTEACLSQQVEGPEPGSSSVKVVMEQLSPCTDYQLDIFATTGGQELPGASSSSFTTEAPEAVEPPNFSLNNLQLTFEPVECAASYKVYEMVGEDEATEKVIQEIAATSVSIDSPPACSDHRYAVAAVVGDSEGPKTSYQLAEVAPESEEKPSLELVEEYNNTIEVKILAPNANMKCQVELYQVKYQTLGKDLSEEYSLEDLSEGNLVLTEVDNQMVEGRIKYLGYNWSPWTESQQTKKDQLTEESKGLLLPVVIVVLVVVVILVTAIIFFIVRRKKRSQNKYNCDNGDKSETKKLNGDGDP